jgi:hypothetical protein
VATLMALLVIHWTFLIADRYGQRSQTHTRSRYRDGQETYLISFLSTRWYIVHKFTMSSIRVKQCVSNQDLECKLVTYTLPTDSIVLVSSPGT